VRLLFTGDILLSRNVRIELENTGISPWVHLQSMLESSDFVFGNLEGAVGPISDSSADFGSSPVFDIKEEHILLLKEAGFHSLSVENNHSFDLGVKGKLKTIEILKQNDLSPVDFENSPLFFKIKGKTVSVIAINMVPGRSPVQKVPSLEVKQKLRLAENLSDLTVVYIHWGSELLSWPNNQQRNAADWLTRNGAGLIIGTHPHVIQKAELINGKPVFFSLGNHLFDQKYAATKKGLIADCRIRNEFLTCYGIYTHTSNRSFFPEVIGEKNYDFPAIRLNSPLMVNNYELKSEEIHENQMVLKGIQNGQVKWKSHPINLLAISLARLDAEEEYLIAMEKHYSKIDKKFGIRPYVYSISEKGLTAKWRGSALAWPLLDAIILPGNEDILCALHSGGSFISLNSQGMENHTKSYRWNGFGFNRETDDDICRKCEDYYDGIK
jgi:hypothetical protein